MRRHPASTFPKRGGVALDDRLTAARRAVLDVTDGIEDHIYHLEAVAALIGAADPEEMAADSLGGAAELIRGELEAVRAELEALRRSV